MKFRLLVISSIALLLFTNHAAVAQLELCGSQASTVILNCTGKGCFGQYSPETPQGNPDILFSGTLVQCCAQKVVLYEQTNLTCRGEIRKLEEHRQFISSLQNSGVHLLIRKCTGGLAPLEELSALYEPSVSKNMPDSISFKPLSLTLPK